MSNTKTKKEIDKLFEATGIGAIPETNDYANGWNDCRKRAFEELQKKKDLLSSHAEQVRKDTIKEIRSKIDKLQICELENGIQYYEFDEMWQALSPQTSSTEQGECRVCKGNGCPINPVLKNGVCPHCQGEGK